MSALILFSRPWWLLALLPLALAWWRSRPAAASWTKAVDPHLLPHVALQGAAGPQRLLLVAAWVCAVLALAGPRLPAGAEPLRPGALRVLVVDLSPGAAAHEERIRLVLQSLLRPDRHRETALLIYAEEPYLVVPPTTDTAVIARFVPELAVAAIPVAGNRPERALRMASAVLERSGASVREIVWIAGSEAALAPALSQATAGRLSVLHAGTPDAERLRALAEPGGGVVADVRDDAGMRHAAALAGEEARPAASREWIDIGAWLLLPLLPLAALRFRHGLLAALPLLLCASLLPLPGQAASSDDIAARRLFDAGHYAEAAARFDDPRWKALALYRAGRFEEAARMLQGDGDPVSLHNRGNALAKSGLLRQALSAYEASLAVRPGDADTVHNRDLVRRLLSASPSAAPGRSGGGGGGGDAQAREAAQTAEQWLRAVPDEPGTLLRRKLQAEQRRRDAGEVEKPW